MKYIIWHRIVISNASLKSLFNLHLSVVGTHDRFHIIYNRNGPKINHTHAHTRSPAPYKTTRKYAAYESRTAHYPVVWNPRTGFSGRREWYIENERIEEEEKHEPTIIGQVDRSRYPAARRCGGGWEQVSVADLAETAVARDPLACGGVGDETEGDARETQVPLRRR